MATATKATGPTMPVRITKPIDGMMHPDPDKYRFVEPGDVLDLPEALARQIIDRRLAEGFAIVRSLRPGSLLVGDRVLDQGEEGPCDPARASRLADQKPPLVEIVRQAYGHKR